MKQRDMKNSTIDIPRKPEILQTSGGTWAMCPNCGKHLQCRYNQEHDEWIFDDRCSVCGQVILDVQKQIF